MQKVRGRFTYANVLVTFALFVAEASSSKAPSPGPRST